MKELMQILVPGWKPMSKWTEEDKITATIVLLAVPLAILAGWIGD